jgi:hypothetical protein
LIFGRSLITRHQWWWDGDGRRGPDADEIVGLGESAALLLGP